MMFEIHNTRFLKASALMHELLILQQVQRTGIAGGQALPTHRLSAAEVEACLERLREMKMVAPRRVAESGLELTNAGEQRLRVLLVDYIRELKGLYNEVIVVFQHKLAEYFLAGVRRVAFYPVGDTAEVVHLALQGSGLQLVAAVDDDPSLWGASFHELAIQPPSTLVEANVDAVICTTAVFGQEIQAKLSALARPEIRLLSLW